MIQKKTEIEQFKLRKKFIKISNETKKNYKFTI